MNKINILDDSIQLYSFAGTEKEILKTFGKKQITYKIENNNIKVFAYNDYFYRGCLWSSDIPLIINDEEYSSIDDIITKLDEWFYSPNEGGGGDIDIDPSLSPTSKNPVANSAITNAINSLPSTEDVNSAITNATSGLASTEWVEAQHYLTEHTPLKTINDQVISGTGNITISADTSNFYSKQETDALLDDKMDVSGMTDYSTKSWVQNQGYLTEHTPLKTINDQVISGTGNIVITAETVDAYTKAETDALLDDKQDVLSAGTGINISGNVISVTLDTDLFVIVQELPTTGVENKFYLVPTENSGSSNVYAEYIYTNNVWEKIGEEVVDVDLTPYLKKTDAAATYLSKTDAASTYATQSELDGFYSKSETDALLDGKADASDIADMATTGWVESQGYLTEHTPLKTINNQVISGTGNIDIPVFQLRWVADGDNYICDMVTHTKYQQDKQQVTFDGGAYYMDIGNVRRGEVIETESVDCGADPASLYKAKVIGLDGKTSYIPKNGSSVLTRGETIPWSSSTVGYMSGSMKEIEIYSAVTEIGQDAFFEYGQLTSITMPNTITTIGQSALAGLNRIENIEIPSSVTSIGTAAFEGNVKMSGLTISNVQQIPTRMCYGCSGLTSFTIPDSVLAVGDGAFSGCSMMTSLTIGSGITSFGASSMAGCSNLVTISAYTTSAPSIGSYNFHGVHASGTLYIPNSDEETFSNWMKTNQYFLGYYGWTIHKTNRWVDDGNNYICSGSSGYDKYQRQKQQVSYNDGTTWEDVNPAVYQCGELIEANSIDCGYPQYRWVDDGDNYVCSGTTKYQRQKKQVSTDGGTTWTDVVPSEYQAGDLIETDSEDCGFDPSINNKAKLILNDSSKVYIPLDGSSALTTNEISSYTSSIVDAVIYSSVTTVGTNAFLDCSNISSITIPDNVTTIGNGAFARCRKLSSITLPSGITSIERDTFTSCQSLSSINIPSGVTSIGTNAFQNCTGLTSIDIPDSVTIISGNTFQNCRSMTSATIGSGVTSIGSNAFYNCSGLTRITSYASTAPTLVNTPFNGVAATGTLYTPNGGDYSTWMSQLPSGWIQVSSDAMGIITKTSDGSRYVISANTETTAGTLTWHEPYNCAIAHSIGQNEDVTVEILPTVTTVGDSSFTTWYGLSSIVIPSTVTTVGPQSFTQCSGLTSITCLATTAPTLDGSNVFNGISSTGTLYYPSGSNYSTWLTSLGNGWTGVEI